MLAPLEIKILKPTTLSDTTISDTLKICFNVFYCNVMENYDIRRNVNSKQGNFYLITINIL